MIQRTEEESVTYIQKCDCGYTFQLFALYERGDGERRRLPNDANYCPYCGQPANGHKPVTQVTVVMGNIKQP